MSESHRIVLNVMTGEQSIVEITPEEAVVVNQSIMDPIIPQVISDRQFFQQAAIAGLITQDEAISAVATGTIPTILQTIVDGITDPSQQFADKMLLRGATIFERQHPLTESVGAALNWTTEQIDQFFVDASKL